MFYLHRIHHRKLAHEQKNSYLYFLWEANIYICQSILLLTICCDLKCCLGWVTDFITFMFSVYILNGIYHFSTLGTKMFCKVVELATTKWFEYWYLCLLATSRCQIYLFCWLLSFPWMRKVVKLITIKWFKNMWFYISATSCS